MQSSSLWTFLVVIISVICYGLLSSRKSNKQSRNAVGIFLANRSNGFILIGASLFFSNISANQFIGENESVFINNMSVIGWGISSVLAMIIVSEYFVPIYLKTGISTIPEFLEQRYDASTKNMVTYIFLFSYILNLLPITLYGGAIAFNTFFDIAGTFGVNQWAALWISVWVIGVIAFLYSAIGGLRSINAADAFFTLILCAVGILLPYYGLAHLGDGSFTKGVSTVLNEHTEHLNAIGSPLDAVPFSTLFTGMIIVNLYYWGMEQYIVQQVLAAKSLADSQKGIVLTCSAKLVSPLLINIPGLIAVHLYTSLPNTNMVFPQLVSDVMPTVWVGLVAAVLFGAAINTFNAGLNGASSLFVFNIYRPWVQRNGQVDMDEKQSIRVTRRFQLIVAFLAMTIAPFILFSEGGFYFYIQKVSGIFSVPIFTIIFIGFFRTKIPPLAAKVALPFFIGSYVLSQFIIQIDMHFLHSLAIIFLLTVLIMVCIGWCWPMENAYKIQINNNVDIAPWKSRRWFYLLLILGMVGVYIVFSPLGLA